MTVSESLRRTGQAEPGSNQAANALRQATATPPWPGDMDILRELFDREIVWHFPGRSPLAGDHRGTDVVLGFFGRTMELTAGTLWAELHDVVAHDRHTVGIHLGTGPGRRGRQPPEAQEPAGAIGPRKAEGSDLQSGLAPDRRQGVVDGAPTGAAGVRG